MKCPNCNFNLANGEQYCPGCGTDTFSFGGAAYMDEDDFGGFSDGSSGSDQWQTNNSYPGDGAYSSDSSYGYGSDPFSDPGTDEAAKKPRKRKKEKTPKPPKAKKAPSDKHIEPYMVVVAVIVLVFVVLIVGGIVLGVKAIFGDKLDSLFSASGKTTAAYVEEHSEDFDYEYYLHYNSESTDGATEAGSSASSASAAEEHLDKMILSGVYITSPEDTFEPETYLTTAGPGLNIRKAPDKDGDTLGLLPYGTVIEVFGTNSDGTWYLCYCESTNQYGWVYKEYVMAENAKVTDGILYHETPIDMAVYSEHRLFLREKPDQEATVIILMETDAPVTVLGKSVDDSIWFYVETEQDGVTYRGFCHSDYLVDR